MHLHLANMLREGTFVCKPLTTFFLRELSKLIASEEFNLEALLAGHDGVTPPRRPIPVPPGSAAAAKIDPTPGHQSSSAAGSSGLCCGILL